MKKHICIISIILISLLIGCKKEAKLNSREHPVLITKAVSEINSTGVTLNAEILDIGQDEIMDYGFILISENTEYKYSIFDETSIDQLNKRVTILEENTEYTCRAYVKTSKHTVYANIVSFLSKGSSSPIFPKIENYSPTEGRDNTTVIITGEYLNLFSGEKSVTVNNIETQIICWEENYIEFITPDMSFFGNTKIKLNYIDVTISLDYKVYGPELTSISNTSGHSGSLVTILGHNFISSDTKVFFDDYEAEIINLSDTLIELLVPPIFRQLNNINTNISISSVSKVLNTDINYLILKSWTTKSSLPFKHEEKDAFIYNNNAYIYDSGHKDLWKYNPVSDSWSYISGFPGSSYDNSLYLIYKNKMFLMGGENYLGLPVHILWEYDFINGTWTQLDNIPFGFLNSAYFIINGIYYIITDETECWTFDPSDMTYTQKNNFPEDVTKHNMLFSYRTDNEVFITTNYNSWKYNVSNDSWSLEVSHNFNNDGYTHTNGMAFNNTAYVKHGWDIYKYFYKYNSWHKVSSFPGSFDYYVTTFTINNKAYFLTGENYYVEPADMFMYEE